MSNADDLLKEAFVRAWLRTGDPFKAGLATFTSDSGRAMRASWEWPVDATVLQMRAEIIAEDGERAGLPTKEEMALEVYRVAQNAETTEDKLAAYELAGKMLGYIERPSVSITNDNRSVTVNRVMAYKDHGDDDAWERAVASNQKALAATVVN